MSDIPLHYVYFIVSGVLFFMMLVSAGFLGYYFEKDKKHRARLERTVVFPDPENPENPENLENPKKYEYKVYLSSTMSMILALSFTVFTILFASEINNSQ